MFMAQEKLTHLVGPIRNVVDYALEYVNNNQTYTEDIQRHKTLISICHEEANRKLLSNEAISYMEPALDDFWYIGKGAIDFLEQKTFDRVSARKIVQGSLSNLCFPAFMPDKGTGWSGVKREWSRRYDTSELFIPESKLETHVSIDNDIILSYSSGALVEMDSYTNPTSGCPARGPIMEKMFAKYIDTIFID